ncbi:MAG: DUF922 domain-containing protein [Gaiellaceae bacterium]
MAIPLARLFLLAVAALLAAGVLLAATLPSASSAASGDRPPVVSPEEGLSVSARYVYYAVHGRTADELRADLDTSRARAENGERHDALSGWYVRWHSLLSTRAQGCSIAQADVSVELTYRLPRWLHPSGVSPDLVGSWKRYLRALRVHEEGHAENGVRTGSRVLHGLRALPPTPSCKRLENRANGMVANEVARGNSWDIAYDRRTGDGAAQGAVFP